MNANEIQCSIVLTSASTAAHGLVVYTNDAARARAMLYRVRRMLGDITLKNLQVRVSPDDSEHELWIVRRETMPNFNPNMPEE